MDNESVSSLVKSTYNKLADTYENFYSEIDEMDREKWNTFISQCCGRKVLDIGCGTGEGSEHLLNCGCIPTGMDFSEGMLNVAKKRSNKINWVIGDARLLPFPDESFFGVILSYTIDHLTDSMIESVKNEIDRVLVGDGLILFAFHVGDGEEIIQDPADEKLRIYYHYFTKDTLERLFENYETIDYFQRASLDPSELVNDKGILTMRRRRRN